LRLFAVVAQDCGSMKPRLATSADTPELLRLAAMMYSEMGLDASGEDWREKATKLLGERLGGDDVVVFAVDDPEAPGRLAACGGAAIIQRLPGPMTPSGRWGYVQWMATEPAYRRRGLAKAVFVAILEWLEARGVKNIELHATPWGEPLYRSFGFKDPISPELRRVGG
jgi:GNAT superfamily N-acetyltransferase